MRHTRYRLRVQSREPQNVSKKYSHQPGLIRNLFSHIFEISKKTFSFIADVSAIFYFLISAVSKKLFYPTMLFSENMDGSAKSAYFGRPFSVQKRLRCRATVVFCIFQTDLVEFLIATKL